VDCRSRRLGDKGSNGSRICRLCCFWSRRSAASSGKLYACRDGPTDQGTRFLTALKEIDASICVERGRVQQAVLIVEDVRQIRHLRALPGGAALAIRERNA